MSLADFLSPVFAEHFTPPNDFYSTQLGKNTDIYTKGFADLDPENTDLAIIGIEDDRGSAGNEGCAGAADAVRKALYSLNEGNFKLKMADLGNIRRGETLRDTYFAVKTVVAELIRMDIVPIIIGGGQDLTYAQYLGYETLEQKVDLVVADARFDMDENPGEGIETTSSAYLNRIFLHNPNYLFNFSNLGYQTYYIDQESLRVMEKLYFDVHRLGELSGNMAVCEPIIRNANMFSFDIGAIRSSDAPGNANASPNGFYGEEACQLCRYAGMNDKLTSVGFYEYNPKFDRNGQTAMLLAQMIWYFIDGFYNRKKDFPLQPRTQYRIYKTSLKHEEHELVFVKSKKTDRWWMQVPYPSNGSRNERFHLVPCRYDDYQIAVNGDMPDLYWRTFQKLD